MVNNQNSSSGMPENPIVGNARTGSIALNAEATNKHMALLGKSNGGGKKRKTIRNTRKHRGGAIIAPQMNVQYAIPPGTPGPQDLANHMTEVSAERQAQAKYDTDVGTKGGMRKTKKRRSRRHKVHWARKHRGKTRRHKKR